MENKEIEKQFDIFCEKVCQNLGLVLCRLKEGRKNATMRSLKEDPNYRPKYDVEFLNLTHGGRYTLFLADIATYKDRKYHSHIGMEIDMETGKKRYEHYENSVSPTGEYGEDGEPIGERQLWQYYEGNSLKRACNSVLRGNSKGGRKPIKFW